MHSINGFSSMYRHMSDMSSTDTFEYILKTKLHGTNGSIKMNFVDLDADISACSKNRKLWSISEGLDSGHMGFEVFVSKMKNELLDWGFNILSAKNSKEHYVQLYGEWAGLGVQKGTSDAVCLVPEKTFFLYAIQIGKSMISDLRFLENTDFTEETGIQIIPEICRINIPFCNVSDLTEQIDQVNAIVGIMETVDTYIRSLYGVEGTGEGVVGSRSEDLSRDDYFDYIFKAKTEAHRVKKSASPMKLEPLPQDVIDLANTYVTLPRMQQAISELSLELEMKNTPLILAWMGGDIKKEAADDIMGMGYEWKGVSKIVNTQVVRMWKELVNGI